jgi:hypothetical protein
VNTLLATVQDGIALGADAISKVYIGGKGCRAVEAAGSRNRLHQTGEFRSRDVNGKLGASLPRALGTVCVRAKVI